MLSLGGMNKARINHFKELLDQELAVLTDELNSIARQNESGDWEAIPTPKEDITEGDEGDMGERFQEFESRIARLNSLETRYVQVADALKRIEAGTFGICLKSGKLIEEDRLEANPAAETCKEMMD